MRGLILLVALCCAAGAQAQNLGWSRCGHTAADEKVMLVRVALLEGSEHRRYDTLDTAAELAVGRHLVEFNPVKTAPITFTGMLISCQVLVPGTKWVKSTTEVQWLEPITINVGATPRLGVLIEEPTPGTLMFNIGKR